MTELSEIKQINITADNWNDIMARLEDAKKRINELEDQNDELKDELENTQWDAELELKMITDCRGAAIKDASEQLADVVSKHLDIMPDVDLRFKIYETLRGWLE